jgi:hypothetical protein
VTHDIIIQRVLAVAGTWEREADNREKRAPGVPDAVAATLKSNALELRQHVMIIERETAYLTVAQYAGETGASESTVRRLCAQNLIEGAERDVRNEWRIPRGAKRPTK